MTLLMVGPSCTRSKGSVVAVLERAGVSLKVAEHMSTANFVRFVPTLEYETGPSGAYRHAFSLLKCTMPRQ